LRHDYSGKVGRCDRCAVLASANARLSWLPTASAITVNLRAAPRLPGSLDPDGCSSSPMQEQDSIPTLPQRDGLKTLAAGSRTSARALVVIELTPTCSPRAAGRATASDNRTFQVRSRFGGIDCSSDSPPVQPRKPKGGTGALRSQHRSAQRTLRQSNVLSRIRPPWKRGGQVRIREWSAVTRACCRGGETSEGCGASGERMESSSSRSASEHASRSGRAVSCGETRRWRCDSGGCRWCACAPSTVWTATSIRQCPEARRSTAVGFTRQSMVFAASRVRRQACQAGAGDLESSPADGSRW
jgi:hypothetical protein